MVSTSPAVTPNVAFVVPCGTFTEPGMVRGPLPLASETCTPPAGAVWVRLTVHVDAWPVPSCNGAHDKDDNVVTALAGLTVTVAVFELPLALPVTVTAVSEDTVPAVTLKPALLAPDATTTDAGVVNTAWLSLSVTVTPPAGAAPLSVTVQPSVWVEITCDPAQVSAVTVGGPATGGLTVNVTDRELLLALPVTDTAVSEDTVPAVTLKLALLAPDATTTDAGVVNAAWLSVSVTVTPPEGAAPLNVTVQPSVWVEITCDAAQVSDVTVCGGVTGALSVSVKERELLLALAVRSTDVVVLTADPADALNPAVDDPDGTVTEEGTETLELLSERDTT